MNDVILWPVDLEAFLSPARGKLNQYEFWSRNTAEINKSLPLVPNNPYIETGSKIQKQRNRGIQITCSFNSATVLAQFHRKLNSRGIWIGSNYTIQGKIAVIKWKSFLTNFKVIVGRDNIMIPVVLKFYPDLKVDIHLRGKVVANPQNKDGV